jgi:replicative DNA helicase
MPKPQKSLLANLDRVAVDAAIDPGEMVLVGSRPGQGKTLMALRLAVEAMKCGRRSVFFTLQYTPADVSRCFRAIGKSRKAFVALFEDDCSDDINADHIMRRLAGAPHGTVAVIDYLQLLDRQRGTQALADQLRTLQCFAQEQGVTFLCLSQISRSYNPQARPLPGPGDVRMFNPFDMWIFTKACFVEGGQAQFQTMA